MLSTAERRLGSDHPRTFFSRVELAEFLRRRTSLDEAVMVAERAWSDAQRDQYTADSVAYAALVLARILWEVEGAARDRPRARELADTAANLYRSLDSAHEENVEEVEQWLDEHPAGG